jgi:hypothetical protein
VEKIFNQVKIKSGGQVIVLRALGEADASDIANGNSK